MENKVRFGPAGNSQIFYDQGYKKSIEAPEFCKKNGLTAYEYSFGRGFTMSEETAKILGNNAKEHNVLISFHAPYYINLANENPEMAEKSFNYITKGLNFLKLAGGRDYVVHLASQGKMQRKDALRLVDERLDQVLKMAYDLKLNCCNICPETMGKYLQIGNPEEIINFCTKDKILVPTFDFGHINCVMQGNLKTEDDYKRIFDLSCEKLGEEKTKNCHIHFSKIEFSDKGEVKHVNLDNQVYGPDFKPLAKVIQKYNLTPTIICESKERMMEDAITLNKIYSEVLSGKN